MRSIAELLKNKRKESGLSLRQASMLTGISHVHIGAIERGESVASFDKTIRLIKIYHITLQELERALGGKFVYRSY